MSGAGVTVTAPLASAADSLSVDGTQPGAVVAARLSGAAKPNATAARKAAATLAWTTLMRNGKRESIRRAETMGAGKKALP